MANIRQQDIPEYRRILDEIAEDYCPANKYCIFKEFLIAAHPSRRLLVQLKCCDKLKWIKSQKEDKDIGWEKTLQLWIEEGHAASFAIAYQDNKSLRDIFNQTVNLSKSNNISNVANSITTISLH